MNCALGIDLSTSHGHLAVVGDDGAVMYEQTFTSERSHNSMLYGPLGEALEVAGDRLKAIIIGTGPGSYTGVRISIAAAYGVALSRSVPVNGVPSIAALCDESYAVIGDARRGKFYAATVREGQLTDGFALLDEAGLRTWLEEHKDLPLRSSDVVAPLGLAELYLTRPSAIRLARHGLRHGLVADDNVEPLYVQEAFITKAKTPTMGTQV